MSYLSLSLVLLLLLLLLLFVFCLFVCLFSPNDLSRKAWSVGFSRMVLHIFSQEHPVLNQFSLACLQQQQKWIGIFCRHGQASQRIPSLSNFQHAILHWMSTSDLPVSHPVSGTSANVRESLKWDLNIILDRHVLTLHQETTHIPGHGSLLDVGGGRLSCVWYTARDCSFCIVSSMLNSCMCRLYAWWSSLLRILIITCILITSAE